MVEPRWVTQPSLVHSSDVIHLQVVRVQVRLMVVCWFVTSMTVFDHRVQQIFEHLICLLVTGDAAHRHDERVTCGDTTPSVVTSPDRSGVSMFICCVGLVVWL